jgi:hypothetical protein
MLPNTAKEFVQGIPASARENSMKHSAIDFTAMYFKT